MSGDFSWSISTIQFCHELFWLLLDANFELNSFTNLLCLSINQRKGIIGCLKHQLVDKSMHVVSITPQIHNNLDAHLSVNWHPAHVNLKRRMSIRVTFYFAEFELSRCRPIQWSIILQLDVHLNLLHSQHGALILTLDPNQCTAVHTYVSIDPCLLLLLFFLLDDLNDALITFLRSFSKWLISTTDHFTETVLKEISLSTWVWILARLPQLAIITELKRSLFISLPADQALFDCFFDITKLDKEQIFLSLLTSRVLKVKVCIPIYDFLTWKTLHLHFFRLSELLYVQLVSLLLAECIQIIRQLKGLFRVIIEDRLLFTE